jgi:hypothetical protein
MTSTITTQKYIASANFRPKGGNGLRTSYIHELQDLLERQWNQCQPAWFITIEWSPAPLTFTGASDHARHFRNKFLCAIYHCDLKQLPEPQDRCKLVWFHERAPDPKGRTIYHSHLHLTAVPQVTTAHHLQWIIAHQVAPEFHCLKHLNRKIDPAVVIRSWNHEHHAFYNLKDFYRFQYHQDHDLLLDWSISDISGTK